MSKGYVYTEVLGIESGKFKLILPKDAFVKNDVITADTSGVQLLVTKVYKMIWWRKLLLKWGYNVKIMEVKKL